MWKKILPISLVLVVVFSFSACAGEPSAQEIVDGVIKSFENIKTCQLDMDVTIDLTVEDEVGTFTISSSGIVDFENRQMRTETTIKSVGETQPEMETINDQYVVDGILYSGAGALGEELMWMKLEAPEEWWEASQQMGWGESQIELLKGAQVQVIGSEKVDGIDCYVIEVTPDLEKLWQLSNSLTFQETPDVAEDYLEEVLRSFSVKQWVIKDTYFIAKAKIDISTEFPPETLGPSKIDIDMVLLSYNYNQPVSIELPPEAEEAIEMPME
jgi:hypothetical protein